MEQITPAAIRLHPWRGKAVACATENNSVTYMRTEHAVESYSHWAASHALVAPTASAVARSIVHVISSAEVSMIEAKLNPISHED